MRLSTFSALRRDLEHHQKIGSQLWAGESPDSNPGLQDNSQERYHQATTPPMPSDKCDICHLPIHLELPPSPEESGKPSHSTNKKQIKSEKQILISLRVLGSDKWDFWAGKCQYLLAS